MHVNVFRFHVYYALIFILHMSESVFELVFVGLLPEVLSEGSKVRAAVCYYR